MANLLVAGDTHGNLSHVKNLFAQAQKHDCTRILQLGDFGFWTHTKAGQQFLGGVRHTAEEYNIPLFFIDGNHENFDILWQYIVPSEDGVGIRIAKGWVTYIPRGTRWQWDDTTFLALGGAHSVDKHRRIPYVSWWPQENIGPDDVERCFRAVDRQGAVDVMVTHDAPQGCRFITDVCQSNGWKEDVLSIANRNAIQAVMEAARPNVLLHGHHHVRYQEYIRYGAINGRPKETLCIGLDCEGGGPGAWTVMNLAHSDPQER